MSDTEESQSVIVYSDQSVDIFVVDEPVQMNSENEAQFRARFPDPSPGTFTAELWFRFKDEAVRQETIKAIEERLADKTMMAGMSKPASLKYVNQLTGFDMGKRIAYVVWMKYVDGDGCLITEDNIGPMIIELDGPKEDAVILNHIAKIITLAIQRLLALEGEIETIKRLFALEGGSGK